MTAARPSRGLLVALEGIDGAGKSTLARRLLRAWRARGLSATLLREPSNLEIGAKAAAVSETDPWRAAIWFTVDRELSRDRVEAALASSDVVLQDRSFYSTLAYQGSALTSRERARLTRLQAAVAHRPDLVVLLEIATDEALVRLASRGPVRAPLEKRGVLDRVGRAYQRLARSGRWLVVSADQEPSRAAADVDARVSAMLRRRARRSAERKSSRRRRGAR